jgi:cysteinyl-tRNA synthetase
MSLKIKNTLSGQEEVFKPIKNGHISMYHCGPTVYKPAHIGNLRAYIFADFLRRFFKYQGYKVQQVINITDVGHLTSDGDEGEDKVEQQAKESGVKAKKITEEITLRFMQDLEKLNINLTEIIFPRATQYINEQISLIENLEKAGLTYKTSDGIYFDTGAIKNYGKLGQINLSGLQEGSRIKKNHEKRNATDFALWKFSEANIKREQEWQSPWGIGFPGWHLECSAMIKSILGQPIDIHTGGIEHVSTHHNNEIAQSESTSKKKLANYWVHLNHILVNGEKMSKSSDNVIYLNEIKNPLAYKYWIFTAHYSTQSNYTDEAMKAADIAYKKLVQFIQKKETVDYNKKNNTGKIAKKYFKKFLEHLDNNFDTPQAIATIWLLLKDSVLTEEDKKKTILEIDKILGLNLTNFSEQTIIIPDKIITLAEARKKARLEKNWVKSDEIRDQINSLGYTIKDLGDDYKVMTN